MSSRVKDESTRIEIINEIIKTCYQNEDKISNRLQKLKNYYESPENLDDMTFGEEYDNACSHSKKSSNSFNYCYNNYFRLLIIFIII